MFSEFGSEEGQLVDTSRERTRFSSPSLSLSIFSFSFLFFFLAEELSRRTGYSFSLVPPERYDAYAVVQRGVSESFHTMKRSKTRCDAIKGGLKGSLRDGTLSSGASVIPRVKTYRKKRELPDDAAPRVRRAVVKNG